MRQSLKRKEPGLIAYLINNLCKMMLVCVLCFGLLIWSWDTKMNFSLSFNRVDRPKPDSISAFAKWGKKAIDGYKVVKNVF